MIGETADAKAVSDQRPDMPTTVETSSPDRCSTVERERYTDATQRWLDARFRATDADGVYRAHQPIYGFRRGPGERGALKKYAITLATMRALAQLDFASFVDVGGAEGYKAALVRELFGAEVLSCDLSQEACERARQIYGIESRQVDGQRLPFADGAFDVVLCSETLEHVRDIRAAAEELLRIARRAVIITVPRDPRHVIERNLRDNVPHAHLHALDETSFDWMRDRGCSIDTSFALSPALRVPMALADGRPIRAKGSAGPVVRAFNSVAPLVRGIAGPRVCTSLVELDLRLARRGSAVDMVFTVCKPGVVLLDRPRRAVRARDIVDFAVPFHRPAAS